MEFRRSGQRDERRRRVLMDEKLALPEESEETPPTRSRRLTGAAGPARDYSEEALRDRQLRVVDLLPTRLVTLSLLALAGLSLVGVLAAAHWYLPQLSQFAGQTNLTAFDLAAPNSLAVWFSSLLYTLGAGWSLLVFSLRRHKTDDYRGRYLIWLPAACALLFVSIDATTGLHRAVAGTVVRLSGVTAFGDGPVWTVVMYGLLFGTLGLRLGIEMRRCRLAATGMCAAAICYSLAAPFCLGAWPTLAAPQAALARAVGVLLGNLGLVAAIALYARHVYLESQGGPVARKAKSKRNKKVVADPSSEETPSAPQTELPKSGGKTRRVDAAHTELPPPKTPQAAGLTSEQAKPAGPLASKLPAATGSAPAARFGDAAQAKASATITRPTNEDEDDQEENDDDDSQLSRAERKRQKKLQRRGVAGKY